VANAARRPISIQVHVSFMPPLPPYLLKLADHVGSVVGPPLQFEGLKLPDPSGNSSHLGSNIGERSSVDAATEVF